MKNKSIKKKLRFPKVFISLLLVFSLAFSPVLAAPTPAHAANATEYVDKAKNAVDTTNSIIKSLGVDKWGSVGAGFSLFMNYFSKGLGTANTILKFLGIGKKQTGPTIEELIYQEVKEMHLELNQVSERVDQLIDELAQFKAETEFHNLMQKAEARDKSWNSFKQNYIEDKMENSLNSYDWHLRTGIEKWCRNEATNARVDYNIENNKIIVFYDDQDNIINTRENGIPDCISPKSYVSINEAALPDTIKDWSYDTYTEKISNKISSSIRTALDSNNDVSKYITVKDYPIFTVDGWNKASEDEKNAALEKLTKDAIDVLLYRISVIEINNDWDFTRTAIDRFNNYCNNLVTVQNEGLDALLQSIFLTNNFEAEAKETLKNVLGGMAVRTSEYGIFIADIVGKSDKTSKTDDKSDLFVTTDNWSKAINGIDSATKNSIKNHDDYNYLVGSRVKILPVYARLYTYYDTGKNWNGSKTNFRDEATVGSRYEGYGNGNISSNMLSESQMQMLNFLYLSKYANTEDENQNTFYKHLTKNCGQYPENWRVYGMDNTPRNDQNNNILLASYDTTIQNMLNDADGNTNMYYDYIHKDFKYVDQYKLFKDFNKKDFSWCKKITGDFIDTSTGAVRKNQILVSHAVNTKKDAEHSSWVGPSTPDTRLILNPWSERQSGKYWYELRDYNWCYYTLVKVPDDAAFQSYSNLSSNYNPLISLKKTLETSPDTGVGTSMGGDNTVLMLVLCFVSGLVIGGAIIYAVLNKKVALKTGKTKKEKSKK